MIWLIWLTNSLGWITIYGLKKELVKLIDPTLWSMTMNLVTKRIEKNHFLKSLFTSKNLSITQKPLALDSAVFPKISKRLFFSRYHKILPGSNSIRSKTTSVFFRFKKSEQIQSLEAFKFWANMGGSKEADWATAKIFASF